jgi:hypothetical protein
LQALGVALLLALAACTPRGKSSDQKTAPSADATADAAVVETRIADTGPIKEALPVFPSDELTIRARHLLEAIAKDDPSLATDIVFPRDAYIESRDAADPGKQWDDKIMGSFQRQVHALHKRTLGVERATFVGFELGQPISQVVPKKHEMTLTLWRVRHSRLDFTIEGKALRYDLGEMLSWRGAWYVTELR